MKLRTLTFENKEAFFVEKTPAALTRSFYNLFFLKSNKAGISEKTEIAHHAPRAIEKLLKIELPKITH